MADLEVIHDPAKEMAAIVNVDTQMGWGPAMIGPDAGLVLQAFIDAMPIDISTLTEYSATQAFKSFLGRALDVDAAMGATPPAGALEPLDDSDVAAAALAESEAREAGREPPAPAPADTDPPAPEAAPSQVVPCFNCDGSGMIEFGDGSPSQRCNMCQGTGKLLQPVSA